MLDNFSLDQLRTFIAAADTGSFSAAGRRLHRAQSVVSQTMANLEVQLGVRLFDRAGRYPVPTDAGRALLAEARTVVGGMDLFKARAKSLAGGLEPELIVVVDVMFPTDALTRAIVAFQAEFPATPLRMYVEALGATLLPVLNGTCSFGVTGSLGLAPPQLTREGLRGVKLVMVVSPRHELASFAGPIPTASLGQHVQLVLTDRSELSRGQDFGVLSPITWRLADLSAKHEFLRAGLGWGTMPLGMVAADLAAGRLVRISLEDVPPDGLIIPMSAIYRTESPPGPAGRWLIDCLKRQPDASAPASESEAAVFDAG
jgi:DNA-binding transcriptional LysR family regulator